jgi:C4-dicarboxylate-specific signal transduction histidine kinase
LQQVLLNLVVNGCDAMQANARRTASSSLKRGHRRKGPGPDFRCRLREGIPPDKLEGSSSRFTPPKDSGLGMGLAICRAIIKSHGGHLWSVNNPAAVRPSILR